MRMQWLGLVPLLSLGGVVAEAQSGVVIRVPDGAEERCVDPYKDRVWLTLRRLVTTKNAGWFKKDKAVSVLMSTSVSADGAQDPPLSFPLMARATFGDAPKGRVSVPIEYPLVKGLVLKQEAYLYTGIDVAITLINLQKKTGLGNALQVLGDITSDAKLPIPSSPLTGGLSYLLKFANAAIGKDLGEQKIEDVEKAAALSLNFSPTGECEGDFEMAGTKAVVFDKGGDGYIKWQELNNYCWAADLKPIFVLKAAKKKPGVPCEDSSYEGTHVAVSNNYVALYLNKQVVSKKLGPDVLLDRDREESQARCLAHGISDPQQCPGGWN